jgi:hypothetical protein
LLLVELFSLELVLDGVDLDHGAQRLYVLAESRKMVNGEWL